MAGPEFTRACEAARRHHAGLKPFFVPGDVLRSAGSRLTVDSVAMAQRIVSPEDDDADLRFLYEGAAVVTIPVSGSRPESVRNLAAPVSIGASTFALGEPRSASVVAMRPSQVLRLGPGALKDIARDSPTVATGLLRWAALDVIDWLRESRLGNDAWSIRNQVGGDAERAFEYEESRRDRLEIDAGTQAAVIDTLAEVRALEGVSLMPLAEALGTHVHLALVKAGQPVLAHNERDGALYLLLDGSASVKGRSGQTLARFRSGGDAHEVLLGEVAFLAQGGRDGTVTADTDCVLIVLPRTSVTWMLVKHGALAVALHHALLRTLCWRMREIDANRQQRAERS